MIEWLRFYIENGVPDMLETDNYDHIDSVSQCFGETVDVRCGNSSDAPLTDVFTQYAEAVHFIEKRDCQPGRTEIELEQLQRKSFLFKSRAKAVFDLYHTSDMASSVSRSSSCRRDFSTSRRYTYFDAGCMRALMKSARKKIAEH